MNGNYQILHLFEKCAVCHKDIKTEDPIIVYDHGERLAYHCACYNRTSSFRSTTQKTMKPKEIENLNHVPYKMVWDIVHQSQSRMSQRKHAAYAVLSRMDREQARIIARVLEQENVKLVRSSGADVIVSPPRFGGYPMADAIESHGTVEFISEIL